MAIAASVAAVAAAVGGGAVAGSPAPDAAGAAEQERSRCSRPAVDTPPAPAPWMMTATGV